MSQPTSKMCTRCSLDVPLDGYRLGQGKHGRHSWCRDCERVYKAQWSAANRDRPARKNRSNGKYYPEYYAANKEVMNARRHEYRARLSARTQEQILEDRARLRPNGTKRCRKCHAHLPLSAFSRAASRADGLHETCSKCKALVRVRLSKRLLGWWTLNGMDPFHCVYCGVETNYLKPEHPGPPMHVDHIVAVARRGTDDVENLAPSCEQCNTSKGTKRLVDWLTG